MIRAEPEKLREVRFIDIPEIEELEETLAFDASATNALMTHPWPELVVVRYDRRRWNRASAWRHLMRNPPEIIFNDGRSFRPVIESKRHPYRKKHGARYWGWSVYTWEQYDRKSHEESSHHRHRGELEVQKPDPGTHATGDPEGEDRCQPRVLSPPGPGPDH